jgi:hypothetical protein
MKALTDLLKKSDMARTPWRVLAEESAVDYDHKKLITVTISRLDRHLLRTVHLGLLLDL